MKKTYSAKPGEFPHKWWVIDAEGKVLGRLATRIADVLRGKDKPTFTHHVDTGDFVVVVNAEKVRLTGNKLLKKKYYHHTGYLGGMKETTAGKMLGTHPERVIELAVKGMLPQNTLSRHLIKKLKIYAGPTHPHEAQMPQILEISNRKRA